MNENVPKLSIGLAVRNGKGWVEKCIQSILAQSFEDFELIISDNASDAKDVEALMAFARADRRINLSINPSNIGLHQNMNRVLRLSRGTYFRWISADDWLEPTCLSKCVQALEARPDAIGVTTGVTLYDGDTGRWEDFPGEFPSSPEPSRRFERMLWFYHAGDAKYDPIYGMYRRSQLVKTQMLRRSERADWLLCAELSLRGPIIHIAERLTNRTQKSFVGRDIPAFRRRLDPVRSEELKTSPSRMYRDLLDLALSANLSTEQMRKCESALRRFWFKHIVWDGRARVANARHRLFGRTSQARQTATR